VPAIEYVDKPTARDHYWTMWKLPLFDVRAAEDVLAEIEACKAAKPSLLHQADRLRPAKADAGVSFVVYRP